MLHKWNRRLGTNDMCKACILFTTVTGISHSIICHNLYLSGNHLHLPADKFLSSRLEFIIAFFANWGFRQFQEDLLFRKIGNHFVKCTLLLSCMSFDNNGIFSWLSSFVVLLFFGVIEQADMLFTENLGGFFTGLTQLDPLGIGKYLVHMVRFTFQLINLCLLHLDLALDSIFRNSHFRNLKYRLILISKRLNVLIIPSSFK